MFRREMEMSQEVVGAQSRPYTHGVRLVKNVRVPVRDGTLLAADLYVPEGGDCEPLPVVMEYIPYRKDDVPVGPRFYSYLPQHGYIVARVDIRGTGASPGVATDEYPQVEQEDGHDVIEWLAAQPFCDGNVNMMGISYGGFTSLQVATHQPPHLRSIIPMYFTDDRYTDDCHYRGGLLRQYYDIGHYGNFMVAYNATPPSSRWSEDWADIWEEHLAHNEPYFLNWYAHQTDGSYWRHGSVRDIAERIQCPVFMIGGWRDGYPNPPLRLYESLQVPRKVLVGPWNHNVPDVAVPGPRIDHLHEVVRWLDHWCKGRDTGVMDEPPVVIYVQNYERPDPDRLDAAGAWRAESAWPAPGGGEEAFYLGPDGVLGDGPDASGHDDFEYDATVGVAAGLWSGGLQFGQCGDQRLDEALSLVYTSAPLDEDLTIVGRPRALLHVSSTATVIAFSVALADVAEDGSSFLVSKGMLNATRRNSLVEPEPLVPGEPVELTVDIDTTAWRFNRGHRVRLAIASSDWPNVWPTPQPATNRVYRGGNHPSSLVLPTVPPEGSATPPQFRPSPVALARHLDRIDPPVWEVVRDALSRRAKVHLVEGLTERIDDETTVRREYELTSHVDPEVPARASCRGRHLSRTRTLNGVTEAVSAVNVQGSATHFHVTIDLLVTVDGLPHHSRQWVRSFPRQLL
ncbi:MAG: CocE/NonD family hydrolase [Acidimicrobiales bacterium]